jgi:uncharacterized protein YifE (UPF0438 family)
MKIILGRESSMPIAIYPKHIFKEYFVKRFKYSEEDLSARERKSLEKNGTRLQALKEGRLKPQTEDERHFLLVCDGQVEPVKVFERAWIKYHSLRIVEEQLEKANREQFMTSAKYREYLNSRLSGLSNADEEEAPPNSNETMKKCPACGGTVYDCWKCNGQGWITK